MSLPLTYLLYKKRSPSSVQAQKVVAPLRFALAMLWNKFCCVLKVKKNISGEMAGGFPLKQPAIVQ